METVLINKLQYLTIGQQGENAANTVQIDMTPWVEEFPNARFHLLFKAYNENSPIPMVTEYDGETHVLTWTITLSATEIAGVGYTEVRALDVENGVLKKSRIIPTTVENSVTGVEGGTIPMPYEDWVNTVLNYTDQAIDARNDAIDAQTAAETAQAAAEAAQGAAETAQGKAEDAQDAAEETAASIAGIASDSEAWAVGTRNGTPVPATDPAYQNNAEYYARIYDTMEAEATSVPYTEEADVELVAEGNHKVMKFKIPVGVPGSSDENFSVDGQGYLCQLIEST
jgi:hypothetical protein